MASSVAASPPSDARQCSSIAALIPSSGSIRCLLDTRRPETLTVGVGWNADLAGEPPSQRLGRAQARFAGDHVDGGVGGLEQGAGGLDPDLLHVPRRGHADLAR